MSYRVEEDKIFVFGSNLAGRHGKGAALFARRFHGAVRGQGWGRQGNSYAIPTKDEHLRVLPLDTIAKYVRLFLDYVRLHPELKFQVTRIGCGLAGYTPDQIAPMFEGSPSNCIFDWEGETYGEPRTNYPLFDKPKM